ncbi:YitT family protein [Paenibacillus gansuensis]|uniref:YitT family protein n=1 Tax=Paenibacillus gansuensis TaxID=306542 RepID=A0ABW5P902_9BACL
MGRLKTIAAGCIVTAAGLLLLKHAHLLTGGTAGLSLTLHYVSGFAFAPLFFLINLPFYYFSLRRLGLPFTISTLVSVTFLSLITGLDRYLPPFPVPPAIGAILGGALIGLGVSVLFSHRSSLGGANILALYLDKKYQWNPGYTVFLFDTSVVLCGLYGVTPEQAVYSVLSVLVTSTVVGSIKSFHSHSSRFML